MKEISDIYYENQMFDNLEYLKETYGDLYLKALNSKEKVAKSKKSATGEYLKKVFGL